MSEPRAILFDIDHFATHDGPGIRTTVFFKGCPLRCQWCHSPESQEMKVQIAFAENRCVGCGQCAQACPTGAQRFGAKGRVFDRSLCVRCGACTEVCASKALFLCGRSYTLEEVIREILPDLPFFQNSGGGVTLTGGEVLMQSRFACALLRQLKNEGIHTLVETSGYGNEMDLLSLATWTDLFYYDFKLWDAQLFERFIGANVDVVKRNLAALSASGAKIVLRAPMIYGITDTKENVDSLFETALRYHIQEVHLLAYNTAAPDKYAWLDRPFLLKDKLNASGPIEEIAARAPGGIEVKIV